MAHPLVLLAGAIVLEVTATLSLRASMGFSRLGPSLAVVAGYAGCFLLLGLALKAGLSVALGYAIWSGVGTAVVAVASVLIFQEKLTPVAVLGLCLIVAGCVVLHLGGAAGGSSA